MKPIGREITWQDIKDLANSLNEDQLNQHPRFWGDSVGGKIMDVNVLDEDYVSDGEAYGPKSEMDEDAIDEDEPIMPAGTVMIWLP